LKRERDVSKRGMDKQERQEGLNANQKSDIPHGDKIPYSLFAPHQCMSQSRLLRSLEKTQNVRYLLNGIS